MISIENLSFSYGDIRIFENFSAEFADNSVTALMGPSGRGKTTLFKLISGFLKPDSGKIKTSKRISVMFQTPRLIPSLTVANNIRIVLDFSANSDKTAAEILGKLNLSDAADKLPSELSGGMAKRAALARALVFPSDVLLIDEPFGELDAENKRCAARVILEYSSEKTVAAIVHDEDDAELLGANILKI